MPAVWNTKWGARRVRHDPPTLAEALAAAQGLTDDRDAQVAIAAQLMGVPLDDAKAEMRRLAPDRRATATVIAPSRDKSARRTPSSSSIARAMTKRATSCARARICRCVASS